MPGPCPCPVCGDPAALAAHGVIAPFVAELIGLPLSQQLAYRECSRCGLGFFDYRFSDGEIEKLYRGYRGSDYLRLRRSWEPWYRSSVNDAYLPGSPAVAGRVDFLADALRRARLDRPIRCAVDFGGDRGQFFPSTVPIGRRVVVDVSDHELIPGTERVDSLNDLGESPDLVIIAHVLEHVSMPRDLLADVRQRIAADGFLYVEVPLERPRIRPSHRSGLYARWISWISGRRLTFVPFDFASGVARQLRWRIPRLGVVKESEHINFFTSSSLRSLLEASHFDVIYECAEPNTRTGGLRLGRLGMVGVPSAGEDEPTSGTVGALVAAPPPEIR